MKHTAKGRVTVVPGGYDLIFASSAEFADGQEIEVSWDAPDPVHTCSEWTWREGKGMSVPASSDLDIRWYWHEAQIWHCPWCGERLP